MDPYDMLVCLLDGLNPAADMDNGGYQVYIPVL